MFQETFDQFWRVILNKGIPYVIFGVGINKLEKMRRVTNPQLLADIVERAEYIRVRDDMTKEFITNSNEKNNISTGICPSINFLYPNYWCSDLQQNNVMLHVVHPADLRMAHGDISLLSRNLQKCAQHLSLSYMEEDNMKCDYRGLLQKYHKARIVVSSRLHGCIISYAMGIPFVPILCDEKTEAFLKTHLPSLDAVPVGQLYDFQRCCDIVGGALQNLHRNYQKYMKYQVNQNMNQASQVREIIETYTND